MKFNTLHLFGTAECIWILTVQNHQTQPYYNTKQHAWVISPLALNLGSNRPGFQWLTTSKVLDAYINSSIQIFSDQHSESFQYFILHNLWNWMPLIGKRKYSIYDEASTTPLRHREELGWTVTFRLQLLYSQGKGPWYLLDRRLGRPRCWSGCSGRENISVPATKQTLVTQPVNILSYFGL